MVGVANKGCETRKQNNCWDAFYSRNVRDFWKPRQSRQHLLMMKPGMATRWHSDWHIWGIRWGCSAARISGQCGGLKVVLTQSRNTWKQSILRWSDHHLPNLFWAEAAVRETWQMCGSYGMQQCLEIWEYVLLTYWPDQARLKLYHISRAVQKQSLTIWQVAAYLLIFGPWAFPPK